MKAKLKSFKSEIDLLKEEYDEYEKSLIEEDSCDELFIPFVNSDGTLN